MTRRHPSGNAFGVTAAEHHAAVEAEGRNWTDTPISRRSRHVDVPVTVSLIDWYIARENDDGK